MKAKIEKLGKSDGSRREELIAQLGEIRDKQSNIKKGKKSVYEQLDALNESIRKKVSWRVTPWEEEKMRDLQVFFFLKL